MSALSVMTDLLPGFVLPLSRLLAKADQWKDQGRAKASRKPNAAAGGTDG